MKQKRNVVFGSILLALVSSGGYFIAQPNLPGVAGYATAGSGTSADPWTGWEQKLRNLPQLADAYFPAGYYRSTEKISCKVQHFYGQGIGRTVIEGSALSWKAPLNTSNSGNLRIHDLSLVNKDWRNKQDPGIEIVALTHVDVEAVEFYGWKRGMAWDQVELGRVRRCQFQQFGGAHIPGMVAIWLVNGSSTNPQHLIGLTNVIQIEDSYFNGDTPDQTYIVDDGGYSHTASRNTFNHAGAAFRLAGAFPVVYRDNYFEGQVKPNILSHKRHDGSTGVGGCYGVVFDTNMVAQGVSFLDIQSSVGTLSIRSNQFYGPAPIHIKGVNNVTAGKLDISVDNYWSPGTKLTDQ